MTVEFVKGDITEADVAAVVNAANTQLLLGAGVAGAIRRKGGPAIQQECHAHGPVPLGEAAVTGGGNLKARHVIHAAGMHLGSGVSREACAAATRNSLARAEEHGLASIAFPAIGTGVGGLGMDECAQLMLEEVHTHKPRSLQRVVFYLFDDAALRTFEDTWKQMNA